MNYSKTNSAYALHRRLFRVIHEIMKYGVVLYGYGRNGKRAESFLHAMQIEIKNIYDKSANQSILKMGGVMPPSKIQQSKDHDAVCVVTPVRDEEALFEQLHEYYARIVKWSDFRWLLHMLPPDYGENGFFFQNSMPFDFYEAPYVAAQEKCFVEKMYPEHPMEAKEIAWDIDTQLAYCRRFVELYPEYQDDLKTCQRFVFDNDWYYGLDVIALYGMLRIHAPKSVIEIGSGYSTKLVMDTSETRLDGSVDVTCIEPNPARLLVGLDTHPYAHFQLYQTMVQDVDLSCFDALEAGDILFIDSSHVIKSGGDVPFELFRILPRLASGVIIHFHDVFYPFCYPMKWIQQGRPYNEAFALRAFLSHNDAYEILFFTDMMAHYDAPDAKSFCKTLGMTRNSGSFWLRKK